MNFSSMRSPVCWYFGLRMNLISDFIFIAKISVKKRIFVLEVTGFEYLQFFLYPRAERFCAILKKMHSIKFLILNIHSRYAYESVKLEPCKLNLFHHQQHFQQQKMWLVLRICFVASTCFSFYSFVRFARH